MIAIAPTNCIAKPSLPFPLFRNATDIPRLSPQKSGAEDVKKDTIHPKTPKMPS